MHCTIQENNLAGKNENSTMELAKKLNEWRNSVGAQMPVKNNEDNQIEN